MILLGWRVNIIFWHVRHLSKFVYMLRYGRALSTVRASLGATGPRMTLETQMSTNVVMPSSMMEDRWPNTCKFLSCFQVTVLGTPAENSDGAKIPMINAGAFSDVDFSLMLSPMNCDILYPRNYALLMMKVHYHGKAAHASAYPWEGRNALDAAVACYNNIALLRQQLKPSWMING